MRRGFYKVLWRAGLALGAMMLIFFIFSDSAAAAINAPTAAVTSTVTTNSIRVDWTAGAGDETLYGLEQSADGVSYANVATVTVGTEFYVFTGLATNTRYWFRVNAGDGTASSSYSTVGPSYTLAAIAGAPTVTAASSTALQIVIDYTSNPSNTTFAVFNTTTQNYLTVSGVATPTATYFATTSWGGSAVGLSPNTRYQFVVIARNGQALDAPTSTASTALYTWANPAASVTATSSATSTMTIQFGTNSNSTSTTYAIYNLTSGTYLNSAGAATTTAVYQASSTWGASITATGLTANTSYQFGVIARNGDSINAATTTASGVYTLTSVPSSVTSSASTASSITVTWSGDGTEYFAYNTGLSVGSGWVTSTSYTFNNLGCAASYFFQVRAKNGDGTLSASSSEALLNTGVCTSGGSGGTVNIGGAISSNGSTGGSYIPTIPASSPSFIVSPQVPVFAMPASLPLSLFSGSESGAEKMPEAARPSIAFFRLPTAAVRLGSFFDFRYTVTNNTGVARRVQIERTVLNADGRVISQSRTTVNQRAGQVFTALPRVTFGRALPAGVYTVRVRVLTASGQVVDTNTFTVSARR